MNKYGRSFGIHFDNPDFVKYAESLGLPGYRVNHPRELLPVLRKALEQKLPSIIEVPVDYRENHRLLEKIGMDT